MGPTAAALVELAALGAVVGPLAAMAASWRSAAQPTFEDPQLERLVLAAVAEDPGRTLVFHQANQLTSADFAHPARRTAYAALCTGFGAGRGLAGALLEIGDDRAASAALDAAADDPVRGVDGVGLSVGDRLEAAASRRISRRTGRLVAAALLVAMLLVGVRWADPRTSHTPPATAALIVALLTALEVVVLLGRAAKGSPAAVTAGGEAARLLAEFGDLRRRGRGRAPVVVEDDPGDGPALRRLRLRPSPRRLVASAVLGSVGFGAVAALAPTVTVTGAGTAYGVAALLVVAILSLVIALVDRDTLLLDVETFVVLGLTSWLLAVASVLSDHHPRRILAGVAALVVLAVCFALLNTLMRFLRGVDGIGFGDTQIIAVTAAVPAVVSGSVLVGIYSFLGASVLACAVYLPLVLAGRHQRDHYFALGPFLGAGWIPAWAVLHLAGAV